MCFYSATHPLDPDLRDGTNGPEMGGCIMVGADCWIAGNVIILPGVTVGDGCTVGAGSVVTKVFQSIKDYKKGRYQTDMGFTFRMFRLIMSWRAIRPGLFGRLNGSSKRNKKPMVQKRRQNRCMCRLKGHSVPGQI